MVLTHLQILFDGGTVEAYLNRVKTFLDANPNEVLTLIFTNPEGASLSDLWDPPFQASGIADLAYVPPHLPMRQSEVRRADSTPSSLLNLISPRVPAVADP